MEAVGKPMRPQRGICNNRRPPVPLSDDPTHPPTLPDPPCPCAHPRTHPHRSARVWRATVRMTASRETRWQASAARGVIVARTSFTAVLTYHQPAHQGSRCSLTTVCCCRMHGPPANRRRGGATGGPVGAPHQGGAGPGGAAHKGGAGPIGAGRQGKQQERGCRGERPAQRGRIYLPPPRVPTRLPAHARMHVCTSMWACRQPPCSPKVPGLHFPTAPPCRCAFTSRTTRWKMLRRCCLTLRMQVRAFRLLLHAA